MAQGRVVPLAAGSAVLAGGAAVEVLAGQIRQSGASAAADWLVGAALVAAALRGRGSSRAARTGPGVWLGLVTAALWYLATLAAGSAGPSGWLRLLGSLTILSYRGPLLHWLALAATAARDRVVIGLLVAGYVLGLTGFRESALLTGVVSAGLAAAVTRASRRGGYPEDLRRSTMLVAGLLVLLAVVWGLAASGLLPPTANQSITAGCLLVVAWHLSRPAGAATLSGAVGSLVLELGPSNRSASPISASLARALADPELQVRTYQPGIGWTDELGRTVDDPTQGDAGRRITDAPAPGGGRIVLLHGPRGAAGSELARAAAAAGGLALESVRVEALVRLEAADVRRSAARLVTVNEVERQAIAGRLRAGAIARLERARAAVQHLGSGPRDAGRAPRPGPVDPLIEELDRVIGDLDRLASGLNPGMVREGSLREALAELVRGCGVAVDLELDAEIDGLREDLTALVYFLVAECLTNVARHGRATRARVEVRARPTLVVEVRDDGRGGASIRAGRGLQGLADRVAIAGGRFEVASPAGGPTCVRAEIPQLDPLPPRASGLPGQDATGGLTGSG